MQKFFDYNKWKNKMPVWENRFLKFMLVCLALFVFFPKSSQSQKVIKTEEIICYKKFPFVQKANNNLDIVFFDSVYYLAFRTAPSHFASKKVKLVIMRSTNLEDFILDTIIFLKTDIREPRFCVIDEKLFLYFFEGGTNSLKFQPKKIWAISKTIDQHWSSLMDMNLDGYVPWRLRYFNGLVYLSAYRGVNLYNNKHQSELRLFTSKNGMNWTPIADSAQCAIPYAEEGEFIMDKAENLWGTIRFEGRGGALFYATKNDWSHWHLYHTKHKFDSALLFNYKDEIYLVARRNISGIADKYKSRNLNLIRYSITKKCTALYRINQETRLIEWILDFPSTGDNAYAGMVYDAEGKAVIFNYSSNPKYSKSWISGQLGKTNIYKYIVDLSSK